MHQLPADAQTVRQPQVELVRPEHVTQPAAPVPADSAAEQSSQAVTAPVSHDPTRMMPLQAAAQQAPSAQASHADNAFLSKQGAGANAADEEAITQPITGAGGLPSEAMDVASHGDCSDALFTA